MTPPGTAALALLGVWMLTVFWATATSATTQAHADDRPDNIVPDSRLDDLEASTERTAERSFRTADD
ncbi:hypothetical protein Htur_3254 [Haloterrigena turkmenica DSM 5511]|uniref:Uncharacterized protein n=1 Tax=Haloterrigena turkmenica (strain ATCC 51198 / DSM 5511 / JCM 9101 / NCIMB 13204 / VKM B-1734 / 4k) TaxID=543526 RepID=D2RZS9_HALTV|nr:hypothetical protein [Haloterrigena turkmenica]ADB62118.1 hypothetical protein Htur_3254 [Haloterrigena turkmenica DSM 5511]